MTSDGFPPFDEPGVPDQISHLNDWKRTLLNQVDEIAGEWFRAVQYSGYVSMSFQELRGQIRELALQLFNFLLDENNSQDEVTKIGLNNIGQKLADLHFLRPDAFYANLNVVRESIISVIGRTHIPDDQVVWLSQRLSFLLVEIARGYYKTAIETVQKEQEQLLRAVKLALEKAQDERVLLEQRNQLLLHSLPDHMFFFDQNGNHLDFFTNHPELLVIPVEKFLHKNVRDVFDEEDTENILGMIRNCFETGEVKEYVFSLEAPSGSEYREIRFIPYSKDQVLCMVRDVTPQKKAEEALLANEARYRAVVEDQTELICRWTQNGTVTFTNQALLRYFELSREQLIGKVFMPPVDPEDYQTVIDRMHQLTQDPPQNSPITIEYRTVLPNGEIRWLEWNLRSISDDSGRTIEIQGVGRDITKLKDYQERIEQANNLLRQLNQQLITTQEQERQAIARNLHDLVLNQLGGIMATTEASISPIELETHLELLINQLREMISDLRPPMLNYGLYTGVLGMLDEIRDRSEPEIETELQIEQMAERLDPEIELHLFRILHQACYNALKHARARKLSISGMITVDQVHLIVDDDGPGFGFGQDPDLSELLENNHFGLAGMVERAMMIGAEVHFTNQVGSDGLISGARVIVDWRQKHDTKINGDFSTKPAF